MNKIKTTIHYKFLKIKTFRKPSIALSMHFLKTKILYRTY